MNKQAQADLVLINGVVYSSAARRGSTGGVAVSGGRIVYVGTTDGAASWLGPATRVIDLAGRMLLPGFHDCHIHTVGAAIYGSFQVPLAGISTREGILRRVRDFVTENPNKADYMGIGWGYSAFPATGPVREDLDAVCPDKPVFLLSCDGHTAWVNSLALTLAGISGHTPDPPGGRIVRHPVTNEPSGWLKEPSAFRLILRRLSLPGPEQMNVELTRFFRRLSAEGITSVMQPGIELLDQEEILQLFTTLELEGRLPLRVTAALTCGCQDSSDPAPLISEMKQRYDGRLFKVRAAKIFLDGVLETRTARLIRPYLGDSGNAGETPRDDDRFRETVVALDREGIQTHIHAIGDGAVRLALDGIEDAVNINGRRGLRHTLAHLDLTDAADIPRFRKLGAVACFQPTWFHPGDEQMQELILCLGKQRAMSLYTMKSFLDSGAVVTCGSDYPAEASGFLSFRPLDGIEMGHTRRPLGDRESECYLPDEKVSLSDMIDGYTIRAAFQLHREKETGSIEVGKSADLIVLDRDLFAVAPHEIHKAGVVLTLLEGREVFRDPSF